MSPPSMKETGESKREGIDGGQIAKPILVENSNLGK